MASADTLLFSESLILSKLRSALQEFTTNAFLRREDAADIFKTAHEVVADLIQEKTPVPSSQPLFPSFTLGGHLKFYRYLNGVWLMYVDNFYLEAVSGNLNPELSVPRPLVRWRGQRSDGSCTTLSRASDRSLQLHIPGWRCLKILAVDPEALSFVPAETTESVLGKIAADDESM